MPTRAEIRERERLRKRAQRARQRARTVSEPVADAAIARAFAEAARLKREKQLGPKARDVFAAVVRLAVQDLCARGYEDAAVEEAIRRYGRGEPPRRSVSIIGGSDS